MKIRIILKMFILCTGLIYASEDIKVKTPEQFYNEDNYEMAKISYLQQIKNDDYSGISIYRYAYSCESVEGLNDSVLEIYALARNLLIKENNLEHIYYLYSTNKLEKQKKKLLNIDENTANNILNKIKEEKIKKNDLGTYIFLVIVTFLIIIILGRLEIGSLLSAILIGVICLVFSYLQTEELLDFITIIIVIVILLIIIMSGGYRHARKDGKADGRYKDNPYLYVFSKGRRRSAKVSIIIPIVMLISAYVSM